MCTNGNLLPECSHVFKVSMQNKVIPPAAVSGLNLVDAVWPQQEKPRPEVRLNIILVAGCMVFILLTHLRTCKIAAARRLA